METIDGNERPGSAALALAVDFHVAVERRLAPTLAHRPVAIVRRGKVFALSGEVRAKGIAVGGKRSNLLELCPDVVVIPFQAERYEEAQRALLDLFTRHVPAVEPFEPTQAFLDVAGLPVDVLGRLAREALAELGTMVIFGLGPTKLMARAAALELARRRALFPGQMLLADENLLRALPVDYLYPPQAEASSQLEHLGCRTMGDIQAIPFEELCRQFGRPLAGRIALAAAGGEADPVRPAWPLPSLRAVTRFKGGLGSREALRVAIERAAGRLAREMGDKGLAASEITLIFRGGDGSGLDQRATRRLQRPGRSKVALACACGSLAGRLLEGWDPSDPPAEMEVVAGRALPLAAEQLDFDYVFGSGRLPASGGWLVREDTPGSVGPGTVAAGGGTATGSPRAAGDGKAARSEVQEVARQLAWRFGSRVIREGAGGESGSPSGTRGPGEQNEDLYNSHRRSRRESLLIYYDPLRANV